MFTRSLAFYIFGGIEMGVPKRKMSKSKKRKRVASHKRLMVSSVPCPKCGAAHEAHRICPSCGTYRGRQVLIMSDDE